MYLTVQGLVLRATPYNDSDMLLSVLTRTHGKLTVKVRGLRRKSSPLTAPCQLLAYGEFTLFEYRGQYTVNEAHAIELFQGLRKDLQKLSLATYFAQVADVISLEDSPGPEILTLTLNCLFALCQPEAQMTKIKAVFEMRCACISGYTPALHGCCQCAEPTPDRFDISAGRLECNHCRSQDSNGIRMPLAPGCLDALRYVVGCDPKKLLSFRLGEENLAEMSQLTESYLMTQLERSFSALDFYKSIMIENI